jgi:hypothetical protein
MLPIMKIFDKMLLLYVNAFQNATEFQTIFQNPSALDMDDLMSTGHKLGMLFTLQDSITNPCL